MRSRVNRAVVQSDVQGKDALIAGFKSFSRALDEKMTKGTAAPVQDEHKKQVEELQNELAKAKMVIEQAKEMDREYLSVNSQLSAKVEKLSIENKKLYSICRYLRTVERENAELRFLLGDLAFEKPLQ